jgi:purine nucleosidase
MTRKIIIDCDPGIDDAVAICMALFDPRLEVLAITATAGTVDAAQSTTNVHSIVGQLDPPRYPRIGKALVPEHATVLDDSHLHGPDGLAGCGLQVSDRQHQIPSDKMIAELVRLHPNEVTVVCLGPLTNLARLCQRDPAAVSLINKLVISGGAVTCAGNATPAAEVNLHFDSRSAKEVFDSATTKSLVPLDVTEQVTFGVQLLDEIPSKFTRAGKLLHCMLPFAFRSAHEHLGRELIPLYDPTTIMAVLEPDLFTWQDMAGRVETRGELTQGATVFDRRVPRDWHVNMEVAIDVDRSEVRGMIIRSLRYAGQQT